MSTDDRIERARQLYERAVFGGDSSGLVTAQRELDRVEADLAMARGQVLHGRFLEDSTGDPQEPKVAKNRLHIDVRVGRAADQWSRISTKVDELVAVGGRVLATFEGHHVVMADPEGNEFCVGA